eukprot:gene1210-912_t
MTDHIATLEEMPVGLEGDELPEPISSWEDAVEKGYINEQVMASLRKAGLQNPLPLQKYSVALVSAKNQFFDVLLSAQTGMGKTFGFVIPVVSSILLKEIPMRLHLPGAMAQIAPLALMLSPTRELAVQTEREVFTLIEGTELKSMAMYGGDDGNQQIARIKKEQIDFLSATPGRVVDCLNQQRLTLSHCKSVVLDEADQMLNMGLENFVLEILNMRDLPEKEDRQTLCFSETYPPKMKEICANVLRSKPNFAYVRVGHYSKDEGGSTEHIEQIIERKTREEKQTCIVNDICAHLDEENSKKVIVFANQIRDATHISNHLKHKNVAVGALHGKMDQENRLEAIDLFREGEYRVLVATNVASRGLDFPDISLVVQYDMPKEMEFYTHRIGRTGRLAASLLRDADWKGLHWADARCFRWLAVSKVRGGKKVERRARWGTPEFRVDESVDNSSIAPKYSAVPRAHKSSAPQQLLQIAGARQTRRGSLYGAFATDAQDFLQAERRLPTTAPWPLSGASTKGKAIAYYDEREDRLSWQLADFMKLNKQNVPEWLEKMAERYRPRPKREERRRDSYRREDRRDNSRRDNDRRDDRDDFRRGGAGGRFGGGGGDRRDDRRDDRRGDRRDGGRDERKNNDQSKDWGRGRDTWGGSNDKKDASWSRGGDDWGKNKSDDWGKSKTDDWNAKKSDDWGKKDNWGSGQAGGNWRR